MQRHAENSSKMVRSAQGRIITIAVLLRGGDINAFMSGTHVELDRCEMKMQAVGDGEIRIHAFSSSAFAHFRTSIGGGALPLVFLRYGV